MTSGTFAQTAAVWAVVFGLIGWLIGRRKGRPALGAVLGVLLGVIGVLVIALVPARRFGPPPYQGYGNPGSGYPGSGYPGPGHPDSGYPGSEAGPVPPPSVPAQWSPDPSGRHELRWWDGKGWTGYVSDGGVQSVDDRD